MFSSNKDIIQALIDNLQPEKLVETYSNTIKSNSENHQSAIETAHKIVFGASESSSSDLNDVHDQSTPPVEKYQVKVLVKESINCPGHVSVSLNSTNKTTHTSFFPGMLGQFINGFTFGSIPVVGHLEHNHKHDRKESDHIFTKNITKEQYEDGVAYQKQVHKDIKEGNILYSVFGNANPLVKIGNTYASAEKTNLEYKKDTGIHHEITADPFGWSNMTEDKHIVKTAVENCSSISRKILEGSHILIREPYIPSLWTEHLRANGFVKQTEEEFKSEVNKHPKTETTNNFRKK